MRVKYLIVLALGILLTGVAGLASADDATAIVSEPSTLALFGLGFAGLILLRRNTRTR